MKKAEKVICPADTGREAQARSLLNSIRCVKSASGYQSAELMRLAFLRPYLTDVTFSNAKSASLLRDMRPVFLRQNTGLVKSASLKCR